MANQGVYLVQFDTLYVFGGIIVLFPISDFQNIKKKLEEKDVSDEFVQLIVACLSHDPKNRPDSQQLIERLIECFDDLGIDDEDSLQITHQISMFESYDQLVQRTIPLRMLKSANL